MLDAGQSVDFIKLFLNVKEKGGYKRVSENGLWHSLAGECGFDASAGRALKLVYAKYLDTFLEHLQRVSEERNLKSGHRVSEETDIKSVGKHCISDICGGCLMDLGSNLEPFLSDVSERKKKDVEYVKVDWRNSDSDGVSVGKLSKIRDRLDPVKLNGETENVHTKSVCEDVIDHGDIQCVNQDVLDQGCVPSVNEDCHASDEDKSIETAAFGKGTALVINKASYSTAVKEDVCRLKRMRESASDILAWIYRLAQDPCDAAIGSLPESSQWKFYTTENLWKQVLLVREARLLKRNVDSSDLQLTWQKKQRMHPMMYGDPERLRYSQRIISAKDKRKSCAPNALESSSYGAQRDEDHQDESPGSAADSMPDYLANNSCEMRVYIGPEYQADVAEWTVKTYEVDSKWSGTRIWPLGRVEQNKNLIERESLGKGRPDSCSCRFPGSTKCVRFHVSEKRTRLRLELGIAFYLWRLNRMGEETAVSWTKEEESRFHDTWKTNPSSLGGFWVEIVKALPNKSRVSLVSYYFNVFLSRRRGDQNRTTPNNITSDDEESDTESEDAKPLDSASFSTKKTQLK